MAHHVTARILLGVNNFIPIKSSINYLQNSIALNSPSSYIRPPDFGRPTELNKTDTPIEVPFKPCTQHIGHSTCPKENKVHSFGKSPKCTNHAFSLL